MPPMARRGVPLEEQPELLTKGRMPDWESVRIFLEVVRRGSFRSAAETLCLSINVLRRRIDELEHHFGATLLTRHVDGVRTTPEGDQIFAAAQEMEIASFGLLRAGDRASPAVAGEVKLAVTEGIGTFWLAPRLVEFQRAHPQLLVDLRCAMRSADVLRLEAHAAVQLTKPTAPDLKIVRLGRLHSMPFASPSYIETYGMPKSREDMLNHRVVMQFADQTGTKELFDQTFPGAQQVGFIAMKNNVSTAHVWAVAKGAGIGWVPTYVHAIGGPMVPIEVDIRFHFDVWLTYHPGVGRIPRVRRMIDWIINSFDPREFPWFRDEFVHPNDLPKAYRGEPLANLFAGFTLPTS
jgi:DNA-binding transcriptional LysR family regulator